MPITRRFMLTALAAMPVAACDRPLSLGDEGMSGGLGEATHHNLLVQTGQLQYVMNLGERFAAEVPTTVNFAFDSAVLDAEAQAILRRQAAWMRQFPELSFRVFGHADLVGSSAYNRQLGLRRARAVVAYLRRQGVGRARLEAVVSLGDTQPLIFTRSRERQNRRAVTEVSGFMQRHPTVMDGQYAAIVHREFVATAAE
ncbi:MAG: OmpA family protein [Pararhodobacter sp.]|nr:OmpA family protein [Pararhodobacter sp.]